MPIEDRAIITFLFGLLVVLNLALHLRIDALSRIVQRYRKYPPTPNMFRSSSAPHVVPAWPDKED